MIRVDPWLILRSCFSLLNLLNQWGDDVEQISYDGVICDLENRRFRILVDRDNGARALHPHNMLNRSADPECQIELGRNRLTRRPDLAVHGQPARVADEPRCRKLSTQNFRKPLGNLDILLFFNSTPDSDDNFSLRKINRLLGFLEDLVRFIANDVVANLHVDGFHRCGTRARFDLIPAKRAILKRHEPRRITSKAHIGGQFALEHLAGKNQLIAVFLIANAVADYGSLHGSSQLGNKIAHLIGMRHEHQLRLYRFEELLQPGSKRVRRIRVESRRFDVVNFSNLLACYFICKAPNTAANNRGLKWPASFGSECLSCSYRFPRDTVQFAFALLDYHQDHVSHKASS